MTIVHLLNKAHWDVQVEKGIKIWPKRGASASLWKTGRLNTVISLALGTAFMLNWVPVGKVWKAMLWSSNISSCRILCYQVDKVQRAPLRRDCSQKTRKYFLFIHQWTMVIREIFCFSMFFHKVLIYLCVCFNILL